MKNVYWMCILLACSIILLSVFVYRVVINYKKYCEEQNWMNALFYILSIIFSSVIAGMFLIKPAIGLVHSIWITL
jgi:putative effector of murein hydrolase